MPKEKRSASASSTNSSKGQGDLSVFGKAGIIKKFFALQESNPHASKASIATSCGGSRQTASNWMKKADDILRTAEELPPWAAKKIAHRTQRSMMTVEEVLYDWYQQHRELGINVGDARLKGTAVVIWTLMKDSSHPDHQPKPIGFSNGWLRNFKRRRGLKKYTGHGESGSVNLDSCRDQIKAIQRILADFNPEDIYNCDETGLFLKAMLNKTIASGPARGHSKGLIEETMDNLDVSFKSSGYMAHDLFDKWLRNFDQEMQTSDRKVALLIDSALEHGRSEQLSLTNIAIIRLLSNTTSLTQPLDASIIRSFKVLYSQEMLNVVARFREAANSFNAPIPNGKFWTCLYKAWRNVSANCIRKCFAHVPTMPKDHKMLLKELGVETIQDQIDGIQKQLIK